jgi:hypothetical protein
LCHNTPEIFNCFSVNQGVAQRTAAGPAGIAAPGFGICAELFAHFKAGGLLANTGGQQFQVAEGRGNTPGKRRAFPYTGSEQGAGR